ncbi:MAG: hypothetical protein IT437_12270 [Phycisphaerales bacterium]|nr:hypothetical protein [Phycisphaerales bacterium]
MTSRVLRRILTIWAALLVAWAAPIAGAQEATGEVQIELDSFGVGDTCRAGEWVGVHLILADNSDRPRDLLVRVGLTDADGDHPLPERVVTSNPGVKQPVWLYFRLPYSLQTSDVLVFNVFEAVETTGTAGTTHAAERLLGSQRLRPQRVLRSTESAMGVLGRFGLGLREYGVSGPGDDTARANGAERTEVRLGLSPASLPDRWMGLAQYDVIVWAEGLPSQLSAEQADAMREWILRGGHLVIVLPRVGQQWTDRSANPLADLLPAVRIIRREDQDLAPYKVLVTTEALVTMPSKETVHVFEPLEAPGPAVDPQAVRILNTPDGVPLVVRRLIGAGAVTLVGLDVTARWFNERGLPDPELFWHRILGKRGQLATEAELNRPGPNSPTGYIFSAGNQITLDRDIADQVAKTGRAAAGLLIGFVVFVAYWLVAGPVGYFTLRRRGWVRHAWIGFVAAAGVFTAIAWGGATAIRPHRVDASHLTLLDHVYGQPYERARSWISLLIPTYGDATVHVGDPADAASGATRFHDGITPWEAPNSSGGSFPDSRAYVLQSRAPDTVTVPTRATVKQFQLDWAGGPRWKMPAPVVAGEGDPGISVLPRAPNSPVFAGQLVHSLPSALTEVTVIAVLRQKDHTRALAADVNGPLLSEVIVWNLPKAWAPDTPLDLSVFRYNENLGSDTRHTNNFFEGMLRGSQDAGEGFQAPDPTGAVQRLTALSLFDQLQPPRFSNPTGVDPPLLARRRAAHGYGLGRWFTEPCLIIIGSTTEDCPSPVPLSVMDGGELVPVPSRGRTIVRWVYPLPDHAPGYSGSEPPAPEDSGQGNG